MTGDVIKSFLVGLGFGVDDASLSKFNKAIANATLKVTALYASTKLAAAGIAYGISEISEGFEQMGYEYHIIAPAINKALMLRRELLKAYSAAGINITKVIQDSIKLNISLAKTKFAFEAIYKSVASRFFGLLTKESDTFRNKLYANMPKILAALEKFVRFIFKAFEATVELGNRLWSILSRVYDFFVMLDKSTDGWSTKILAVIAAWKLLNLEFLATPLGQLLAGFLALLALYDDFKTFTEGGKSLINWGSDATKMMVGFAAAVVGVGAAIAGVILVMRTYAAVQWLVNAAMAANPIGLIITAVVALTAALAVLILKWKDFKELGFGGALKALGEDVYGFIGGPNVAQNLQKNPVNQPLANPVGSNVQNSQVNQNVTQQTNISVTGSADANAVGKNVIDSQNRVNFDLTRNMKGAVKAGPYR